MTIGKKIIELRKKDNLTQERLAEKLKISRQTLSNWESDNTSPDLNQAKELSEIFKVSLDDLVDNALEVECKGQNSIISNLKGKTCFIDMDSDDYQINFMTVFKVIDIDDKFIKVEFISGKKTITKMFSLDLISSIRIEKESEN